MGNLKKQTKTILLHNGMQDDVDDFLIESPAVEYVENGQLDKEGVISKRAGFEALTDNELTSADNGAATTLVGGSVLAIPYKQGIATYDSGQGSWSYVASPTPFTTASRELSTEAGAGACHFHFAKVDDYTVVVYEVAGSSDLTLSSTKVFIEIYNASRSRTYRASYTGHSPQCVKPTSRDYVIVTYATGSVGSASLKTIRINPSAATASATRTTSVDMGAEEGGADYNLVDEAGYVATSLPVSGKTLFLDWSPARPTYKLSPTATGAVVTYFEHISSGGPELFYHFVSAASATSAPTVSAASTLVTLSAPSGGTPGTGYTKAAVLDAAYDADTVTLYVMYREYLPGDIDASPTSPTNKVCVTDGSTTRTLLTATSDAREISGATCFTGLTGEVATCGSLLITADYLWAGFSTVAYTLALDPAFSPALDDAEAGRFRVATLERDLSSHTNQHTKFGWRLSSKLAPSDDGVVACVQQSNSRVMSVVGKGGTAGSDVPSTHGSRPRTTYFCEFTTSRLSPACALAANKGTTTAAYNAGMSTTLPDCVRGDSGWYIMCPILEEGAYASVLKDDLVGGDLAYNHVGGITPVSSGTRRAEVWFVEEGASPPAVAQGDGIVFASGILMWFDGQRFVENTPLCAPDVIWAEGDGHTQAVGVDPYPLDAAEVHSLYCMYSYTDAMGITHRSAPGAVASIPKTPLGGGSAATTYTITVTSPLSLLPATETLVLEVYFLTDGVYKRVGSYSVTAQDSTTVDIDLVLGGATAIKSSGRLLYTEGGTQPADPAPFFRHITAAGGRLFGITDDPKGTVVFSKLLQPAFSAEFPISNTISLPPGLSVTGIAGLDDKVAVFSDDDIHIIYGAGPDNTGRGSGFAIMRLPMPIGCIDPKSIAETPAGIIFRGRKGFHVLGRDLTVSSILGASDVLKGRTVVAATTVTKCNEVRFLLEETGTTLDESIGTADSSRPPLPKYGQASPTNPAVAYNYAKGQWLTLSNYDGVAAAVVDGTYYRLRSDFSVWKESESSWSDPSGDNHLKIITPWIKLNGLQSYGRIWSATFLGRYLSDFTEDANGDLAAGDITIKVAYDYEKDDTQTHVFQASEELQPELRDGETVSADRLQIKVVPKRQKCSAIRFTIEETDTADADGLTYRPGQGFEIPAIELELGMKETANRSLSAQRKK